MGISDRSSGVCSSDLAGLGGPVAPEAVKRYSLRTHYGPVFGTATVNGEPVAISTERSTFLSDVDTAAPFALLTTTGRKMNEKRFKQLFNSMTSTFNWLYLDSKDLAYIPSGLYRSEERRVGKKWVSTCRSGGSP